MARTTFALPVLARDLLWLAAPVSLASLGLTAINLAIPPAKTGISLSKPVSLRPVLTADFSPPAAAKKIFVGRSVATHPQTLSHSFAAAGVCRGDIYDPKAEVVCLNNGTNLAGFCSVWKRGGMPANGYIQELSTACAAYESFIAAAASENCARQPVVADYGMNKLDVARLCIGSAASRKEAAANLMDHALADQEFLVRLPDIISQSTAPVPMPAYFLHAQQVQLPKEVRNLTEGPGFRPMVGEGAYLDRALVFDGRPASYESDPNAAVNVSLIRPHQESAATSSVMLPPVPAEAVILVKDAKHVRTVVYNAAGKASRPSKVFSPGVMPPLGKHAK